MNTPACTEVDEQLASTILEDLVQRAENGEMIVLTRNGLPTVRLEALHETTLDCREFSKTRGNDGPT